MPLFRTSSLPIVDYMYSKLQLYSQFTSHIPTPIRLDTGSLGDPVADQRESDASEHTRTGSDALGIAPGYNADLPATNHQRTAAITVAGITSRFASADHAVIILETAND